MKLPKRVPHHDIDDKDSNVTERATTSTQVCERFVTGGIDDQETRNLVFLLAILVHNSSLLFDSLGREVSSTNLLCDTTGFTLLDIGLTDLNSQ